MKDEEKKKIDYLLILGIVLIIISILFAIIMYFSKPEIIEIATFVSSLISSGGVALIIISLVESRHLTKSLEVTSNRIVGKSTQNLDSKFKETFSMLEHARYNGLVDILAPRQDEDRGDETKENIADDIETTKSIISFSISGLDFFSFVRGPGTAYGRYYIIIQKRIEEANKSKKPLDLKIKTLLMNPDSRAARFRNRIETIDDSQGNIRNDIKVAIEGLKKLNDRAKENFIEYQLYSDFPQVGFILTDSYVYIEPYHYAPTKELCDALKGKGLKASTSFSCCTGGRIPVFQFHSNSNMYVAMKEHFKSIWKLEEERQKRRKRSRT